jgi:hypothetical protein
MLTFHGKSASKEALLKSLEEHKKHDEFLQGTYFRSYTPEGKRTERFKGCAVGCTLGPAAAATWHVHKKYEYFYGIPEELASLEDDIFERLSVEQSKSWPIDFILAMPVSVDIGDVMVRILRRLTARQRFKTFMEQYATPQTVERFFAEMKKDPYIVGVEFSKIRAKPTAPTWARTIINGMQDANGVGLTWWLAIIRTTRNADEFERAYTLTGFGALRENAAPFLARLVLQTLRRYRSNEDVTPKEAYASLLEAGISSDSDLAEIPPRYRPIPPARYKRFAEGA